MLQVGNIFYLIYISVDLARVRKEMEIEVTKREKDLDLLKQKLSQVERDSQLAVKQREQMHEEETERLIREKVLSQFVSLDCMYNA